MDEKVASPFYQAALELNGVVFFKQNRKDRYFRVVESNDYGLYPLDHCLVRISESFDVPSTFTNDEMMKFLANNVLQPDEVVLMNEMDIPDYKIAVSHQKAMMRRERKNAKRRVSNLSDEQKQKERERKRVSRMSPDRVVRERQRKRVSNMTKDQVIKQRERKRQRKNQASGQGSSDMISTGFSGQLDPPVNQV